MGPSALQKRAGKIAVAQDRSAAVLEERIKNGYVRWEQLEEKRKALRGRSAAWLIPSLRSLGSIDSTGEFVLGFCSGVLTREWVCRSSPCSRSVSAICAREFFQLGFFTLGANFRHQHAAEIKQAIFPSRQKSAEISRHQVAEDVGVGTNVSRGGNASAMRTMACKATRRAGDKRCSRASEKQSSRDARP